MHEILGRVARGELTPAEAAPLLRADRVARLEERAALDVDRQHRGGIPEVILAGPKRADDVAAIAAALLDRTGQACVSRMRAGHRAAVQRLARERAAELIPYGRTSCRLVAQRAVSHDASPLGGTGEPRAEALGDDPEGRTPSAPLPPGALGGAPERGHGIGPSANGFTDAATATPTRGGTPERSHGMRPSPNGRTPTASGEAAANGAPHAARRGRVGLIAAGTSDLEALGEARMVCDAAAVATCSATDVGVAGLHRLFDPLAAMLRDGVDAVIVAAGMDGALPSVVAGLVDVPVIGLPTSTGYGAGGKGEAALLSMLQTCAPGLVVVNVDNGVGAGAAAVRIARRAHAGGT